MGKRDPILWECFTLIDDGKTKLAKCNVWNNMYAINVQLRN